MRHPIASKEEAKITKIQFHRWKRNAHHILGLHLLHLLVLHHLLHLHLLHLLLL